MVFVAKNIDPQFRRSKKERKEKRKERREEEKSKNKKRKETNEDVVQTDVSTTTTLEHVTTQQQQPKEMDATLLKKPPEDGRVSLRKRRRSADRQYKATTEHEDSVMHRKRKRGVTPTTDVVVPTNARLMQEDGGMPPKDAASLSVPSSCSTTTGSTKVNSSPSTPTNPSKVPRADRELSSQEHEELLTTMSRNKDKAREMAQALDVTREDEEAALVRYPFQKRSIEAVVAEINDYLEVSKKNRLSFEEFHDCCQGLTLESEGADCRMQIRPATPFPQDVTALPIMEKHWHDLYCVAVPTLYMVDETNGDLIQRKLNPGCKNFFSILRELWEQATDTGIIPSKSKNALAILKVLQARHKPVMKITASELTKHGRGGSTDTHPKLRDVLETPASTDSKDNRGPSYDVPIPRFKESESSIDLTNNPPPKLDDRIKAVAKERERRIEEKLPRTARDERVVCADRLYTHACQVLRRINDRAPSVFGSKHATQLRQEKTKCVMTFKDVVEKIFPDYTPRTTFTLMNDIVNVTGSSELPGQRSFLRWQDPKNGLNGIPISNEASVWIDIHNYRRVRAVLTGENMPVDLRVAESDILTRTLLQVNRNEQSAKHDEPNCPQPLPENISASAAARSPRTLKSLVGAAEKTGFVANQAHPTSAAMKSGKRPLEDGSKDDGKKRQAVDSKPAARLKDDTETEDIASKVRAKKGLRINPHQILCDEDYDGGTVIQAFSRFPRDLRRLFHSLNNGKRV
ncbi:hypothetical protein IV203_015063 [Nitzschia inconspicua]|uniref:Uncharacterized protein n=1 Tax=Nitzschia inconspicua TaxID=303405 RepID=A0A9K3L9V1_9STRA|nr:hypothetical protein IV203_015063 [Nitzschia inconspicua]